MTTEPETRTVILRAAKTALLESGYGGLSTRRIAEGAGVPLSQIHYHFGSKQGLVLAVLDEENRLLLERQRHLYGDEIPLWKQWEQACDFLEDDLASGYVRVLHEMTAAGWSDPEIASAVKDMITKWFSLLAGVARRAREGLGAMGPFAAEESSALAGAAFLGAETMILLGISESEVPFRSALRKVGELLRVLE